jgi:hypothetical protein
MFTGSKQFSIAATHHRFSFCQQIPVRLIWGAPSCLTWSWQFLVPACPLHQCLFVCHQMFRKIVLGGTILLFVTRATFSTKSFRAAVFLCHISIPNLFQATSNKRQITNLSSTDPCFISVTATLRGVSFHSQSFLPVHIINAYLFAIKCPQVCFGGTNLLFITRATFNIACFQAANSHFRFQWISF